MKDTFLTFGYKSGFIHTHFNRELNREVVQVQADKFAYIMQVKSVLAAKILITKNEKSYGGNANEGKTGTNKG